MTLPGRKKTGQILALGHSDTVWPMGTLRIMPFREADGRLWGPGVLDMKAGIAFFLFAARALRELDIPAQSKVLLQVNSDEEVGSESSRALTEKNAAKSKAVLVLEPGTGLEGKLKTARKGVGDYTVTVRGRASHAGVDFQAGASAVLELARQIDRIAGFTQLERGMTVNPGVISGGTRVNVVAAEARAEIDIRVLKLKDAPALEKKFRSLRPFDKRCTIEVTGGLNRPPMERSAGIVELFRRAQRLAREIGRGARGIDDRRRVGRQFHGGAGRADAGRAGRGRRRRACGEREHPGGPDCGSDGADCETAGDALVEVEASHAGQVGLRLTSSRRSRRGRVSGRRRRRSWRRCRSRGRASGSRPGTGSRQRARLPQSGVAGDSAGDDQAAGVDLLGGGGGAGQQFVDHGVLKRSQ